MTRFFLDLLARPGNRTHDYRVRHRDGHYLQIIEHVRPVCDAAGRVTRVVGTIVDISPHLQAQQEYERLLVELERTARDLEEQRALLETVLEHLPTGVMVVEAETCRVLLRNEAFEHIVQKPVPVGGDVVAALQEARRAPDGPVYPAAELPPLRALTHGEVVVGEEMALTHPDGTVSTILCSAAPVPDAEGRVTSVVSVFHDITGRTRLQEAERARAREARLLEVIQEATPNSLAYLDRALRFLRINSGFAGLVRLPAREILGRTYSEVLPGHEESAARLRQVLATGEPIFVQESRMCPAAGRKWALVSSTPITRR